MMEGDLMKGYGQFCPIAKASEVIGQRWTNLILRELGAGSETFNDIRKGLPLMSPSLLSTRLKSLERAGVITRNEKSGHVRYQLSKSGEELVQIIWQLGTWGQRWVRSDLSKDDLDPSMLVWDIHRTIDSDFFENERTVIKFEFTDYTSKFRYWWIVIKDSDVDVCLKDQGFDVDLTISSDLWTLTAVWMGEITIKKAMREQKVNVTGSTWLRRNIATWLGTNYYADVESAINA
ncbi:MAG: helix-turn-helix domain-containing protein [Candidatus Thiodiazotropha endolucinida]|nr:helix-turn-helix transcriptional regulator [Candidatus Thiodiazotropha taylori]MCG8121870.1 helix-turn-helix transcriptional regulator [Candidatus Thiodiazotropha taylori]MCW4266933.1 helix-turn-helix transcriptional regulator [Candidatus Thiodiazotropha endolucinida]MCW4288697.1 helix-turn-helix transcriptional regulator [Candidatus Thiodiazotropha endolucinida]MCW4297566.1 helix-turn-helix transcriptional regulator [Candidatus Thiodiazotropha endolucinida]